MLRVYFRFNIYFTHKYIYIYMCTKKCAYVLINLLSLIVFLTYEEASASKNLRIKLSRHFNSDRYGSSCYIQYTQSCNSSTSWKSYSGRDHALESATCAIRNAAVHAALHAFIRDYAAILAASGQIRTRRYTRARHRLPGSRLCARSACAPELSTELTP